MSTEPTLAVLDSETLIARTAAFLYANSAGSTGDAEEDLGEQGAKELILLSQHLLVYIGVLPEDWEYSC